MYIDIEPTQSQWMGSESHLMMSYLDVVSKTVIIAVGWGEWRKTSGCSSDSGAHTARVDN